MPKPHTFPTLLNSVLQLKISVLKRDQFLVPGTIRSGTLSWSHNGNKTASIGITVNMASAPPYVELDYKYRNIPRNYQVRLISVPSNLGNGEIWYFLCPNTGKRCRILYCIGGYFLHREAFRGAYYDSQIRSKKMRYYDKMFGALYQTDKLYDELHKPYFKPYYNGQPTKRHIRINKKLHEADRVSVEDWEKIVAGIL